MVRRIAAALLALTILVSVLPTGVRAEDDHVYDIGETIWVTGIGNAPAAQTVENGYWAESLDPNGDQVKEPGCTKEIHEHTPEECWDAVDGLVCTKEEHTPRRHALVCSFLESKYQWVVLERAPAVIDPAPGPGGNEGEGDGLESDGSGIDDPKGYVNFVIQNVDPDGNPIPGSKFLLVEKDGENYAFLENQSAAEELQNQIEQQTLEQQEKLKELQEQGDTEALNAYIEQANAQNQEAVTALNELDNELIAKTTGADGKVYFRAIEKYLAEDKQVQEDGKPTWNLCLVQAEVSDSYKPNNDELEVKIVQTGETTYDLSINGEPYDEESEGFTFVNEILNLKLLVRMQFIDQDGKELTGTVLEGVTGSVTVKGSADYEETVTFPVGDSSVHSVRWQKSLTMLQAGTYSMEEPQVSGVPEGYTFERTTWEIQLPKTKAELENGTEAAAGETLTEVTLGKELTAATFIVTSYYKKTEQTVPETTRPPEPEKPVEYTIIARSVDEAGNGIPSAKFSLAGSGITAKESGSDCIYTINTEACVPGDYLLKETSAPYGYHSCGDQYTVTVEEDGDVILSKGGIIQRLFTRTNLAESGGTETILFRHSKKTAQISLTSSVAVYADPLCWNYNETVGEFLNKKHDFVLEWMDNNGVSQKEILNLGSETKTFANALPYGTAYKVYPADPSGYSYELEGKEDAYMGTVGEDNALLVDIFYEIVHGGDLDLYFTKVDAKTDEALEGAKFSLRNADGQELRSYTTKKGGAIDVEDMIDMPGKYTLKETKAPEEYDVLRKPIEIDVKIAYRPVMKGGVPVMEQYLYADVVHRSVSMGKDGTYWIKNTASGDNPKTGDSFDLRLWTGVMVVSLAGLAVVCTEARKKRSRR